ncbi:MAG: hypothetical protein HWD61_02015 [Parachlamydiaceae bacterium]|nr:MAG: hypothetical protein HWD61_02015 [Parachlamydiaceae bacterium]
MPDDQKEVLLSALRHTTDDWIFKNAKTLSPKTIQSLVQLSFVSESHNFLPVLFKALTTEPIDKEKLSAYVTSLPSFKDEYKRDDNYKNRKSHATEKISIMIISFLKF